VPGIFAVQVFYAIYDATLCASFVTSDVQFVNYANI